jgi:hypothetical protein
MAVGWLVKESPKGPGIEGLTGPNGDPVICADFAHFLAGGGPGGFRRIDTDDLGKMAEFWLVKESPKGPGTPPDCGGGLAPQ